MEKDGRHENRLKHINAENKLIPQNSNRKTIDIILQGFRKANTAK